MAKEAVKRKGSPTTENGSSKKQKSGSHKEQKVLQKERKAQNPRQEMITRAKQIWERLRRGDISRDETKNLMDEIMSVIKGHVQDVIFKHDASRIIQTCLKKGNAEQRNEIANELAGRYEELAKSMYGKFLVMKAIEYCPQQRDKILAEFRTHIPKLVRHKEASTVIETFYVEHCTAAQRQEMLSEFYGPEMTLFRHHGGAKTLEELLQQFPQKKEAVLKFMSNTLAGCMDKGTVVHSIVHKVLLQYLQLADPKGRENIMGHLRDNLQEILHTREGSKVARICLSYASPKDRKNIMKNFKPYLVKIAKDEYGYLVLIRLLDVVDDTVLLHKIVISELCKNAKELFPDKYGRRVFLYILAGRNTKYFYPDILREIVEGDEIRQSKKDPEVRSREILESTSPELLKIVAERAPTFIRDKLASQVVKEIMLHAVGDKTAAINAILNLAGENIEKEDHVITDRFANRVIKSMVKADIAEEKNDKAVEPLGFAPLLLEKILPHVGHFATNFGSFIVLSLLEEPSTAEQTKKALKPHKKAIKEAASNGNEGAKLILELLK